MFDKARLLAALVCFAPSAIVIADEPMDVDRIEIKKEITITASHKQEPVQDVPASIDIIELKNAPAVSALNTAADIAERLDGVQAAIANGTQIAFQIRGIGAVDHQALTPGAAAIYADGVFLATNVQTGSLLFDLERVEVLKGPQATLYGRNASSGAIHFNSVRPGADQSSYVRASYGSFDRVDLTAALGGALSDRMHFRLAGRFLSQSASLENVQTNPQIPAGPNEAAGETERYGARFSLLWEGDDSELLFRSYYETDQGINPTPRNANLDVEDFQISSEGDGIQNTDNHFYGASIEWQGKLGSFEGYSLTAFTGYQQEYGFDFDGTPAPFGVANLNANLSYDRNYYQLSQEFRLQKDMNWGRLLLGANASYDDFDQVYTIWCGTLNPTTLLGTCRYVGAPGRVGPNPASIGVATTLVTDINQERLSLAGFARAEIALSENWLLVVGGRLTHEDIDGRGEGRHLFDDGVTALNNRDGAGPAKGENSIADARFNFSASLRYDLKGDTVYASVSNGFKSGGFNGEVANNALHYSDEGLFEAETVTAYEVGYKGSINGNFTWSLAAFYQDYQSPQARIFVNFALPEGGNIISNSLSNLDQAESYGFEADVKWAPIEGLTINAGLTLLETEIHQTADLTGNAAQFDGNALPFASRVSATIAPSYRVDISNGVEAVFGAAAKYRSGFYLDAEGLEDRRQDGYMTLSAEAKLLFKKSGLAISLFGRNLLNEDFALSGFGFIGYNTFRSAPRIWGASLALDF